MSNLHVLETLPGIISQLVSDLAETVGCAWAIVVSRVGTNLLPLYTYGEESRVNAGLANLSAQLQGEIPAGPEAAGILCPVQFEGENLAVIALGPRNSGEPYTPDDRGLVAGLAAHISSLMANDRLASTVARSIGRLREARAELETARQVQRRFLPGRLNPVRGLDYYGACREAGDVGSDFFDFVAPDRSSLLLSVGDVSTRSIPSAIIMAGLQASLRAFGLRGRGRVSSLVRDLNRMVCDLSPDDFYATMFYARIDAMRRKMQYVNAGHEPPLLIRNKEQVAVELETTGTVLGLSSRTSYRERSLSLEPGDLLVAVSEERGAPRQRVLDVIRSHPHASSSTLANHLIQEVDAVVVVRFLGAAALQVVLAPPQQKLLAHVALAG